jgi:Galactose oxidase-like, Early set domain/Glyoxal oxidase N-terminus/FlgD Ig-like domain/Kelch motif
LQSLPAMRMLLSGAAARILQTPSTLDGSAPLRRILLTRSRWSGCAVAALLIASAFLFAFPAWAAPPGPDKKGQWAGPYAMPSVAIHMHLLPDGNVFTWADDDDPDYPINGTRRAGKTRTFLVQMPINGIPGAVTEVPNDRTNLFCCGHTFLTDGRLFCLGGHMGTDGYGSSDTNILEHRDQYMWAPGPTMLNGRWYASACSLPNGDVVVVGGTKDANYTINDQPEVWRANGEYWDELTTARLSILFYPWMHVAPNGQVFVAGPEWTTRYLNTDGTGSWTTVGDHILGNRSYGSSVMYADGKILVLGGSDPPTATAEVIDLNQPTPAWRSVASMQYARRQCNATLLPDGKVLVTGGTSSGGFNTQAGQVFAAELWDPATETFSTMASMLVPRLYHSTAILLPDGRVLSAGGGRPKPTDGGSDHSDAEIYSPPYLFKGARPVLSSSPATVTYGQTFAVQTPDAASITQVTWIRLSSVTHAFNMNQRINRLSFTQVTGGLSVTAPASNILCPPGQYLMFILNGSGVPSVAKLVQIVPSSTLAVGDPGVTAPRRLEIHSPWPNPTRGHVRFTVGLPRSENLAVEVLDVQGRTVRSLHHGAAPARSFDLAWDGFDERGRAAPPGLYFVRARAGTEQAQVRFVRIR